MPRTQFPIRQLFIITLIICLLTPVIYGAESPKTFHLVILHSNDFHGAAPALLARQATMIRQIRAEEPNVLVLNAGDLFTRGKYQYVFYGKLEFAALNVMGTDALTLGNNEFKAVSTVKAQEYLQARIRQAKFPVLCANVLTGKDGSYLLGVKPFIVTPVGGVKIGILGVTTGRIKAYPQTSGFRVMEPVETVKRILPAVQAEAEIVIALTHLGCKTDKILAKAVPGLAAIVGGDSHTSLWEPVNIKGIPIVQAGSKGKLLGRIDLYFEFIDGSWKLQRYRGKLIRVKSKVREDPEVKRVIDDYLGGLVKTA
jgi:2',3'-cyclic-nucleotide 2'-phosphodiesterase (5'-nucleotidase family)